MTREILFRGKRIDNGEWVEGFYVHIPCGRFEQDEHLIQTIKDTGKIGAFMRVDPSTVGQYTGLCDKNGRKAFTADITEDGMGRRWVIFDCAGGFGICLTTEWVRNGHELHNGLSDPHAELKLQAIDAWNRRYNDTT